ncbi:MAG: hypothetical protein U5N85_22715 [Arcicella sp.]|nr:hypothetical protein [Arcicella sp.]
MNPKFIILLLFVANLTIAQKIPENKINVCMIFTNNFAEELIKTRILFQNKQYSLTSLDTCISLTIRKARNYQIIIEANNYTTTIIPIKDDTLDLKKTIKVSLIPRNHLLNEVVVRPNNRIRMKNDTIIINIDSIKVKPHGNTTDLLKKIPDVRVGAWGNVEIMGKSVNTVTINGRQIYGGNVKATLETIKADMIENLEITQSKSGQNGISLNLKLKKGRDNGWYGESSVGLGNEEARREAIRINRITPKLFFNYFLNENTINEKALTANAKEHINSMVALNGMDGAYSLTQNQISFLFTNNDNRGGISSPNIDKSLGINKSVSGGINFTNTTSKSDWNGFLLADLDNQKLEDKSNILSTVTNKTKQISTTISDKSQNYNQFWSAVYGNLKPNKYINFKTFTIIQAQINKQITNSDTELSLVENDSVNILQNSLYKFLNQNSSSIQLSQKLLWTQRYSKTGFVTSIYGAYHFNQVSIDKIYRNNLFHNLSTQNNHHALNQITPEHYLDIQFAQSIPLNKKILFEIKNGFSYDNTNSSQYVLKYNNATQAFQDTIKELSLSKFQVSDLQNQLQTNLYFKNRLSDLIIGVNIWYWNTLRPQLNYDYSILKFLPTFYWRWNYTKNRHLFIYCNQSQRLPNFNQLYPLADSSSLQQLPSGNPYLRNYPKFQLGGSIITSYGIITIQPSISYEFYNNILSLNSTINQNNTISQNFVQQGTIKRLGGGVRFYHIPRTGISWSLNSNFSLDNQTTFWQENIVETSSYYLSLSSGMKWIANEKVNISMDVRGNVSGLSQQKGTNYRSNLILTGEYSISQRTYLDASFDLSINRTISNQLLNYPIIDFSFSQFLFKNNSLKLVLSSKNIFDVREMFNSFILPNTQTEFINNRLPRFIMISGTFYIEKWAKNK